MPGAMRPLDGITVVTLEHAIAAPFCTRQLADLGARVIKIERPGVGDFARAYDERVRGLASHFVWTNRSKESLTLDVKHEHGQAILKRLILECADVVVQNLAPGAAARLGVSHAALSVDKPGLIVCDISGYGSDGPYRDKKAYDLLIQSESGFLSVTGTPDEPTKAGCSIADIAAGMYAYSNILAALMERGKTGCRMPDRRLDARKHGRVDGVSAVLRVRGRGAAAARGCGARDDLSVRTVSDRRWQDRHAGFAERARMGGVLSRGSATAGARNRSAVFIQLAPHRGRAPSCVQSLSRRSRNSTPCRSSRGWTPRKSRTHG